MSGKLCKITQESTWVTEVPNHIAYRLTPMVSPKTCPGARIEFYVGEFEPGKGRAVPHIHENEDHVFYVLSGRATSRVGDEVHLCEPGDALWVPAGEIHDFDVVGGETFRVIATFSPPRHL